MDINLQKVIQNKLTIQSDGEWLEVIKKDLPNFPDEIITEFILPFAKSDCWPPISAGWRGRLRYRDLNVWRNVAWSYKVINLSTIKMSPEFSLIARNLIEGYVNGEVNMHSKALGKTGKHRFDKILEYMEINKSFPKPIILFKENNIIDVLDGCHRYAAWNFLYNKGVVKAEHKIIFGEIK